MCENENELKEKKKWIWNLNFKVNAEFKSDQFNDLMKIHDELIIWMLINIEFNEERKEEN